MDNEDNDIKHFHSVIGVGSGGRQDAGKYFPRIGEPPMGQAPNNNLSSKRLYEEAGKQHSNLSNQLDRLEAERASVKKELAVLGGIIESYEKMQQPTIVEVTESEW